MFFLLRYEPLNSIGFLVLIGLSSGLVYSNFAERILKALSFSWLPLLFPRLYGFIFWLYGFLLQLFGIGKNKEKSVPEKTQAFYKDVFKLKLVMDQGWIQIDSTSSEMTACVSNDSDIGSCAPVPDLFIEVNDIEIALNRVNAICRVKDADVAIEYGPETEPCGIRRFIVREPSGKLVNVFQCKNKVASKQGKPQRQNTFYFLFIK